jgi:NAD(P)-dependent dehydrogenase (short-subunit alcohol dehydrogenase family)
MTKEENPSSKNLERKNGSSSESYRTDTTHHMYTPLILQDKVAIVTGSTKGNGRAIAELFSAQGANVVIVGRDEVQVASAVEEIRQKHNTRPLGLRVDITSEEDIARMMKTVLEMYNGHIDILVNNAGFPIRDELWDEQFHKISEEDLRKVMDVDTMGTFRCCVEVLPVMMKQESGGVIINISSTPAIAGYDKGAPYTIAKSAILGITKHVAKEYGKYRIRCNAIAPGTIATRTNWDRLSEAQRKDLISGIPLGRPGRPEDIAGVALMLASDYCEFVNGQTIVVDGGEVTV